MIDEITNKGKNNPIYYHAAYYPKLLYFHIRPSLLLTSYTHCMDCTAGSLAEDSGNSGSCSLLTIGSYNYRNSLLGTLELGNLYSYKGSIAPCSLDTPVVDIALHNKVVVDKAGILRIASIVRNLHIVVGQEVVGEYLT